jgi:hypothetical protein
VSGVEVFHDVDVGVERFLDPAEVVVQPDGAAQPDPGPVRPAERDVEPGVGPRADDVDAGVGQSFGQRADVPAGVGPAGVEAAEVVLPESGVVLGVDRRRTEGPAELGDLDVSGPTTVSTCPVAAATRTTALGDGGW